MRKPILILSAICLLFLTNCTKAKETLDSLNCLNKLVKLNNNDDDLSCTELISALKGLKNSCGDDENEIQEVIDVLKSSCED